MNRYLGLAVTLIVVMPGVALAQSPDKPVVELGAQGTTRTGGKEAPVGWALRLTVPLKHGGAIEGTADIQKSWEFGGGNRRSSRELSAQWRQTLLTSGRWRIFGVLGAGRNRVEHYVPEWVHQNPDGTRFVSPAGRAVVSELVLHFGSAVQVEVAPWLALRGDLRGTKGEHDTGLRGMVGAVIPIRHFWANDQPAQSTPPPAAWRRVTPGREVWLTTNTGSLLHGEIAAISDSSVSIGERGREVTIRLADVRLVEGRDSLKNGFLVGGASGAVAGGVVLGIISSVACYGCDGVDGGPVLLGAAAGLAVGGFVGAIVDRLIPGRQTLFGGSTTVVTPVITPTGKAVNVAIRWR